MEEAGGNPSLVLVEQHEALRDGLAVLLERRGFDVLGRATTAARGEEVIQEKRPTWPWWGSTCRTSAGPSWCSGSPATHRGRGQGPRAGRGTAVEITLFFQSGASIGAPMSCSARRRR
jgi:hypothetical protein